MIVKLAKLAKLSACPCGFPALDPKIPLGTVYEIAPDKRMNGTLICGGCGKAHKLIAVLANGRLPGQTPGYLPECLFSEEQSLAE